MKIEAANKRIALTSNAVSDTFEMCTIKGEKEETYSNILAIVPNQLKACFEQCSVHAIQTNDRSLDQLNADIGDHSYHFGIKGLSLLSPHHEVSSSNVELSAGLEHCAPDRLLHQEEPMPAGTIIYNPALHGHQGAVVRQFFLRSPNLYGASASLFCHGISPNWTAQ
jgi:hypothetical protein